MALHKPVVVYQDLFTGCKLSQRALGRDYNLSALLSSVCIPDWTPVWTDCIWELSLCYKLRWRQPKPQDQCDSSEPLQQLWLPGGNSFRPGSRPACVPPETATSRCTPQITARLSANHLILVCKQKQTAEVSHIHLRRYITSVLSSVLFHAQCAATRVPWISLERLEVALTFVCLAIATRPVPAAVALDLASAAMESPAKVSATMWVKVTGVKACVFFIYMYIF